MYRIREVIVIIVIFIIIIYYIVDQPHYGCATYGYHWGCILSNSSSKCMLRPTAAYEVLLFSDEELND